MPSGSPRCCQCAGGAMPAAHVLRVHELCRTKTRGAGYARRSSRSTINLAGVGLNRNVQRAQYTCRSEIVDCSLSVGT